MSIKEVLSEIDRKPFIGSVAEMVYELSGGDNTKKRKALELMKMAVRCACLLDLYSETGDMLFFEEMNRQRDDLYRAIPKDYHKDLISIETGTRRFFEYEEDLKKRIKAGESFSEDDVMRYLLGKSSDNLFYGRLLQTVVPEWNLTHELRIQTMLFDMGKDIEDYQTDVESGLPNVLYMYLSGEVERNRIPHDSRGALSLANELGVSLKLLGLGARSKDKSLASKNLNKSPTLRRLIVDNYNRIGQLLGCSQ